VTSSWDKTLRLWDLKTGVVLKKMKGHHGGVGGLVVSRDGQLLASSDENGELIVWYGETDESLIQLIKAHSHWINLRTGFFYFSPDETVLVTASSDNTTKLWNAKTWQQQGKPIKCDCSAHK